MRQSKDIRMKRKRIFWLIMTLLWVAVIFSFSLQPSEVSEDVSGSILQDIVAWFASVEVFQQFGTISQTQLDFAHAVLRKCAHFTEFGILGVLSSLTLSQTKLSRRGLIAIGFCLAIAAMDETIQLFVGGRAGRVLDVLIDGSGALVGIAVIFGLQRNKKVYKGTS